MQLSATLAWLVDAAPETPGADRLLAEIGARLVEDGLPLAGGTLTMAVPHPLIARRTWLWRADSGELIEALGFVAGGVATMGGGSPPRDAGPRRAARPGGGPRPGRPRRAVPGGASLPLVGARPLPPTRTKRI